MTSAGPARTEPTGAHRPLDRHDITVVTGAAKRAASTPVATSALKSRAPSMCTGSRPAAATTASSGVEAPGHAPRRHVGLLHDTRCRAAG